MQELIKRLNWNVKDDHSLVIELHRLRVLRAAERYAPLLWELPDELRGQVLDHPDFYAWLLKTIRNRRQPSSRPSCESELRDLVALVENTRFDRLLHIDIVFDTRYGQDDRARLLSCLTAAFIALEQMQPRALDFVLAHTRMLFCHKRTDRSGFFSSSQITHIGRVTFENILESDSSIEDLVSALVHESIHSHLYMMEESGRFLSTTEDPGVRVASPWTGNSICIHSFVHACYVWYSLKTLWKKTPNSRLAQLIDRGFSNPAFEKIVRDFPQLIGPELRDNLLLVRERALGIS